MSVYTVSQVTKYISHMFEEDFALGNISIKGEISNYKKHSSGHLYFTLKDENTILGCIMFFSHARSVDFPICEGMQVIAKGSIRVFDRDGKYQLYVTGLKQEGSGNWYRLFEERKKKLQEMGMFAPEYKKSIPHYCQRLGVVTAATGAAIHDIINIAQRRNPYVSVTLYPALVQGRDAADSIVRGIEYLDTLGLDCIIVGRGGGSIEDLWAFNEESVAMAVFQCDTPIISAVGHETDFTIADFAADMRAPTPSAAAELAVFDYNLFMQELASYQYTMRQSLRYMIEQKEQQLENCYMHIKTADPKNQLQIKKRELERVSQLMHQHMLMLTEKAKSRAILAGSLLEQQSPLKRLQGGYAFITDTDQKAVVSIEEVSRGQRLLIHMQDGIIGADAASLEYRKIEKEGGYDN